MGQKGSQRKLCNLAPELAGFENISDKVDVSFWTFVLNQILDQKSCMPLKNHILIFNSKLQLELSSRALPSDKIKMCMYLMCESFEHFEKLQKTKFVVET